MNILCVNVNVQNLKIVFVMSSRTVSAVTAQRCQSRRRCPWRPLSTLPCGAAAVGVVACCCLLPVLRLSVDAARCPLLLPLIEQPTVSDQQLILKSVHVSDSVCTVREVKVNLSRYDILGVGRE